MCTHRQRDGIRGSGVDGDLLTFSGFRDDVPVVDIFPQRDDFDTHDAGVEGGKYILKQVMRQGPDHLDFLKGDGDGFRFVGTHPDGQEAVGVQLAQDDESLWRHKTDTNAVYNDFYHFGHR